MGGIFTIVIFFVPVCILTGIAESIPTLIERISDRRRIARYFNERKFF